MALCSAAQVKAFCGITATTWDTELGNLVNRVDQWIKSYCGRKIEDDDYSYLTDDAEAILDGNNDDELILPEYPINSVTTVRINEVAYDESESVFGSGWYIRNASAGILGLRGYKWLGGKSNIELVYNAGYETVPTDLVQAAIEICAMKLRKGPKEHEIGVTGRQLIDGSETISAKDVLDSTRETLDFYRKKYV
ncbi:MAG: phage head-tail connector protein [Deltaproteobacteria bacterium]|nr:phage head-tail connector protein [Deltaproteobacteria bacterium]